MRNSPGTLVDGSGPAERILPARWRGQPAFLTRHRSPAGWVRSGSVHVAAVSDIHNGDDVGLIVYAVDDSVRSTSCAEPVVQWWRETFAYSVGFLQQRSRNEVVRRRGHCFRQLFG